MSADWMEAQSVDPVTEELALINLVRRETYGPIEDPLPRAIASLDGEGWSVGAIADLFLLPAKEVRGLLDEATSQLRAAHGTT